MLQRVWRGTRARKKLNFRGSVQKNNSIWHMNRTPAIGQNIVAHHWVQKLFTLLTDRTSMPEQDFAVFIESTPVELSLRHDVYEAYDRAYAKHGEMKSRNFSYIAHEILENVYRQMDRACLGYILADEAVWLAEFVMGFRDTHKLNRIKEWMPVTDGKVPKLFVISFLKKYWLSVLSRNDDMQHKCFLGTLGTLMSAESVTTLMPEQASAYGRRRERRRSRIRASSKGADYQDEIDKIIDEKLRTYDRSASAAPVGGGRRGNRRARTRRGASKKTSAPEEEFISRDDNVASAALARFAADIFAEGHERSVEKKFMENPWALPVDIGGNAGKKSKAKDVAKRMLEDSIFVQRNANFDQWESLIAKTKGIESSATSAPLKRAGVNSSRTASPAALTRRSFEKKKKRQQTVRSLSVYRPKSTYPPRRSSAVRQKEH